MNQEITDPVLVRALAGYYRHDPNPQVGPHVCKVEQHTSGKLLLKYAVIRTTEGVILAAYRIRTNGALKRMKRIPMK